MLKGTGSLLLLMSQAEVCRQVECAQLRETRNGKPQIWIASLLFFFFLKELLDPSSGVLSTHEFQIQNPSRLFVFSPWRKDSKQTKWSPKTAGMVSAPTMLTRVFSEKFPRLATH